MLEETESLLTIGEVAVAFAGFASVVSLLGQGKEERLEAASRWSLRGMIMCSLGVLFCSLFPLIPDWFDSSREITWRASGIFLALTSFGLVTGGYFDSTTILKDVPMLKRMAWLAPLGFACTLGTLIAFGALRALEAWLLVGLFSMLALAGLLFANIVMSQIAPRK